LNYDFTGASFTPPSTQADAIGRQCDPNDSDGLQNQIGLWAPLADTGQGCVLTTVNQGAYFRILGTSATAPCYPNCDGSTIAPCLNVQDFGCFLNKFANGDSYANCDNSTIPADPERAGLRLLPQQVRQRLLQLLSPSLTLHSSARALARRWSFWTWNNQAPGHSAPDLY
jgi:hypothetical protein